MQKKCSGCGQSLDLEAFNFKNRSSGKRQPHCRTCTRQQLRDHYLRNPAYYRKKARARGSAIRADLRRRLLDYLRTHACVDCGEVDAVVLQFDHRERSTKSSDIATLFKRRAPWAKIMTEIDKCVVRCANCHQRRTARQFGWYRLAHVDCAPVAQLDRAPVFGTGGLRVRDLPGAPTQSL